MPPRSPEAGIRRMNRMAMYENTLAGTMSTELVSQVQAIGLRVMNTKMLSLDGSEFSDLTILCQGFVFKVHKVVVCPQSKVLATCVNGSWEESKTNTIKLHDDNPYALARMIAFFYVQALDTSATAPGAPAGTPVETALGIVEVYIIADFYDVPQLKQLAIIQLAKEIWESADAADSLPEALRLLYTDTGSSESDQELKDVALRYILAHRDCLLQENFKNLLDEIGQIAIDLLTVEVRGKDKYDMLNELCDIACPRCGSEETILAHFNGVGHGYECTTCTCNFISPSIYREEAKESKDWVMQMLSWIGGFRPPGY